MVHVAMLGARPVSESTRVACVAISTATIPTPRCVVHAWPRADKEASGLAREFAPTEDLASYPRTLFSNLQKLRGVCTSVVFAPTAGSMYPQPATDTCAPLNISQALNPSHSDALPAFRTFAGILGVHACSPEGAARPGTCDTSRFRPLQQDNYF
jgi:hypothetical protein